MGRLILTGVGISLGMALWPIALPILLVMVVTAACGSREIQQAEPSPRHQSPPRPLLTKERAQAMAQVRLLNEQHLNRCLDR